MILQAYGEDGAFPLFMLLAVHLPLMMGCATFLIEADGQKSILQRLRGLAVVLFRNPIFLALIVGLSLKGVGVAPGGMVKALIDSLAGTASTCALIALGAGLVRYRVLHDLPSAMVVTVLKTRPPSPRGLGAGLPRLHDAPGLRGRRHPVRGDAGGHQRLPAGRPLQD